MAKRLFLFLATNLAIVLTVSAVLGVLQAAGILNLGDGGMGALAVVCFVYGMVAAFISLALSRWIAKRSLGVRLVDDQSGDPDARWLLSTVANLARQANLPMPEVGIYESPEVNAFATGPSKKRSLVAVSRGLLGTMSRNEAEAVLGHEISHVANGDMVTLTLIQGVVNAFVLYLSHVVASIVRAAVAPRDANSREPSFLSVLAGQAVFMVCQIVFSVLGSMVVAWFSRRREFRADQGGAGLAGRGNMIAALRHLMSTAERVDTRQAALQSFKIAGGRSLLQLFATHPPLLERIAALERMP
jgi:heat shock protein HtpX